MSAVFDIAPEKIQLNGEESEVREIRTGQLPAVVRCIHPMLSDVTPIIKKVRDGKETTLDEWLLLIGRHGDAVISLISVLAGVPENIVQQAGVEETVTAAVKLAKVNVTFFSQSFPRMVQAALGTGSKTE